MLPQPVEIALGVGFGGSLGALGRYYVSLAMTKWLGDEWPYGTLTVNLIGCLVLGILAGMASRDAVHPLVKTIVMTGFLGAFTTFSTFAVDGVKLAHGGAALSASAYLVASVIAGFAVAYGGYIMGR